MAGQKTRNGGRWTEARYNAFIKGALRNASRKWGPISDSLREARVGRGEYLCNSCKEVVPATTKDGRRRVKNVHVDHILPVIDPNEGFTTWDSVIERLFVEKEGLQVLCSACHKIKSDEEKAQAKARRTRIKEEQLND